MILTGMKELRRVGRRRINSAPQMSPSRRTARLRPYRRKHREVLPKPLGVQIYGARPR